MKEKCNKLFNGIPVSEPWTQTCNMKGPHYLHVPTSPTSRYILSRVPSKTDSLKEKAHVVFIRDVSSNLPAIMAQVQVFTDRREAAVARSV
jgi:hypothetical protein